MTQTIRTQEPGGVLRFQGSEVTLSLCDKRTVKARYFSDHRWRTTTFSGQYIILQGIGNDGAFNGELKTVPLWWFNIWYQRVESVSSEKFTARKTRREHHVGTGTR